VLSGLGTIADSELGTVILYMAMNNSNTGALGIPYSVFVNDASSGGAPINDSDHDFVEGATTTVLGGKMMYTINPVCIPVNEIIEFDATFDKATD
jgi:hypothetical protein